MKKTNNRPFLFFFSMSSFFILLLPLFVYADEPNEVFLFNKLVVLDTDDSTGKNYGEKIGKTLIDELAQMLRFDLIPPEKVHVQHPLSQQSLGELSEKLQADGFIVGRVAISNKMVNISLEILDRRGEMFALELLAVKEQASPNDLEKSIRELVVRLIGRIPYKADVTRVENGMVTFDAGRVHGVEIGSQASLFEIIGVKRHPFTNEIISFSREDIEIIQVTQVEDLSATGKIISRKKKGKINAGHKVDFIPSERLIRENRIRKNELMARIQSALEMSKTEEQQLTKGLVDLSPQARVSS